MEPTGARSAGRGSSIPRPEDIVGYGKKPFAFFAFEWVAFQSLIERVIVGLVVGWPFSAKGGRVMLGCCSVSGPCSSDSDIVNSQSRPPSTWLGAGAFVDDGACLCCRPEHRSELLIADSGIGEQGSRSAT